jgi:hypothetical protein
MHPTSAGPITMLATHKYWQGVSPLEHPTRNTLTCSEGYTFQERLSTLKKDCLSRRGILQHRIRIATCRKGCGPAPFIHQISRSSLGLASIKPRCRRASRYRI